MKKLFLFVLITAVLCLPAFAQMGGMGPGPGTPHTVSGGPTAPTLVSYTQVASWTTGGATKTLSTTITWSAGDTIAVLYGAELDQPCTAPTATGLTFTILASNCGLTSTSSGSMAACAVAASGGTQNITIAYGGPTGDHWGFGAWVFHGGQGCGNAVEQHTATKTVSLTPTGAHGAILWAVFDFASAATTGITGSPTPSNSRQSAQDGSRYTRFVFDLTDQSSSGATSYGITGGSGTGPFSIVALEIKSS